MENMTLLLVGGGVLLLLLLLTFITINQGYVAIITVFGKYRRILGPGLHMRIPFIEVIYRKISIQNRSVELEFQAVTQDQANVYFKAMVLYAVINQSEEALKNVAFKFVDERNFMQALIRTIEGTIRSFVATKKQAEILGLRTEIVLEVKQHLDSTLESWGYHMIDIQINDITFDEEIIKSMAKVVATTNLRAAAENEGQALLITKTKAAEAEGNAIKISAAAEKEAAMLRGQGVSLFRQEVAKGMAEAAKEITNANMDASFLLFSMWTESIKHFAEQGNGNVIFLDGSVDGMQKTLQQMAAYSKLDEKKK